MTGNLKTAQPAQMSHGKKIFILLLLVILICGAVLAGGTWYLVQQFDSNDALREIEKAVKKETGHNLKITSATYSFPSVITFHKVYLTTKDGAQMALKDIEANISLLPILSGKAVIGISLQETDGYLKVEIERSLTEKEMPVFYLWASRYPISKVLKNSGQGPLPVSAVFSGRGMFKPGEEDLDGFEGSFNFSLDDIVFSQDAFKDLEGFKDKGDLRKALLRKLKVSDVSCTMIIHDGYISNRECGGQTSFGRIKAQFRDRFSTVINRGKLNIGFLVYEPRDELKLYLFFTGHPRQDGGYHFPATIYFKGPDNG